MTPRDLFAREALALIPKILTLQDRNAHSPTYGCFDRNFWHYKIIDFPSGMAAEFVIPVCVMIGSTFGGMAGVAIAMICDRDRSASGRRSATE